MSKKRLFAADTKETIEPTEGDHRSKFYKRGAEESPKPTLPHITRIAPRDPYSETMASAKSAFEIVEVGYSEHAGKDSCIFFEDDSTSDRNRDSISHFCYLLLNCWMKEVKPLVLLERLTAKQRAELSVFTETVNNISVFVSKINSKQLPNDILFKVTDIFSMCHARKYASAHSAYLKLSIGNAPWPIGVTMVVIHERSAHDKLHNVPHVLNDETSRKWIQSIKRLITVSQRAFPALDFRERFQ